MMSVWERRAGPDPPLDSVLCEGQRKTSQVWKLQGEGVEHHHICTLTLLCMREGTAREQHGSGKSAGQL